MPSTNFQSLLVFLYTNQRHLSKAMADHDETFRAQSNASSHGRASAATHTSSQSSESRRTTTRHIFQEIQSTQARRVPQRPKSWWGLRDDDAIRPPPRLLKRYIDDRRKNRVWRPSIATYHEKIARADDPRGPGGLGMRSPVVELLREDAAREDGKKRLLWRHVKILDPPDFDKIKVWEISSVDGGRVCSRKKLVDG